jgi:uncharacterized protein
MTNIKFMEQENCFHHGKFKMIVVLVLVLGVVALGILAILRDKIMQNDQYQFTVSADGKVMAPPDIATVDFNVQTAISKNIGDIVKEGNTKMNAIIDALTALKIDKKDIQTTQYQLNPIYNYPVITLDSMRSNQTVLQGYQLTEGITVKIRDLNTVGDAIQAAIAAGANQTGGVSFTIDDQDKLKGEARADAINKAIQKAQDIAKQSGLKLGKLINVAESSGSIPYYANSSFETKAVGGGVAAAPAPSIQSGQLEIDDTVMLTYKVK